MYTRSDLKIAILGRIHNKAGILTNFDTTVNNSVREAYTLVDFRSSKRRSLLPANLFNDDYQYTCPTDLKGIKIIGLQPQNMDRSDFQSWNLVSEEEFDRRKQGQGNLLSFSDRDFTRKLLIAAYVDEDSSVVDPLDDSTGWAAFGDAVNIATDYQQFIKSSGSIKFGISAVGGTTAGIYKTVSPYDLTDFLSNGSIFVWTWITSPTDLTNFKIRLGSDDSNYYEMTTAVTNEGLDFTVGWNLLRFDFADKTTTGTPDDDACDYVALYMTKAVSKISETDYRFDHIILQNGQYHNLIYYSKYPWQSSTGAYKANSTADTDYINVDEEEYSMILEKLVEHAANEIREYDDAIKAANNFTALKKIYLKTYKSEALHLQSTYYNI